MKTPSHIHISLGSNIGNRLDYLQKAVEAIYNTIGDVVKISGVYQTPAWGFSSDDFYNACVLIKTFYTTEEVLDKLLEIENSSGRNRTDKQGYEARTIDLDVVFSSEGIIQTQKLVVPHPSMQDRIFVLKPLEEIAAEQLHPVLKQTVSQLLGSTKDTSKVTKLKEVISNPKDTYSLSTVQYLTIEGNIGAGKTSLAHLISEEFNAKLVLERFADNPFLPKFYEDMERYAFPLEMSFLADRYQRLQDDIGQFDLFKDFVVSDYDVFKSLIFAQVTLQEEEYKLYKKVFDIMYRDLPKPRLYLYLYQNTERLLENIKKRGRDYEQKIPAEYLDKINQGYLQFIKAQSHLNVKIIDISERDFISNRTDYIWVLNQLLN
ncbi:2-amino-4-hydroxy-6-hydroxymethyldihydropteridine diphosphokinase [Aquimarina sp. AD1]|uniref:2-amino-4-hydroxy-6- hydroxymethyldihydropteridine diphosphokinase n=1 Tax=Aquimarina sp. (strain AD1) TaxID=1714848 RepID=UPI000E4E6C33|nr:2-amino-4-hydroxy-6-hydroxymethyldihydropteridine diphosphokinase [Aquimarina sp. AD1]AXT57879.1 2-amino-4-hydroxy-6-hydroxymethyldihydropteridine diphosphokinase [Aquimarina sp. AD1]RKN28044.1 2-amino-4-hydroxy-6-hydroxymethyldihydropteridine diphosphokinase [Aquimarina sp. AD1]